MGNCDPYSDSPEPMVVKQPQFTRVEEPTLLCNQEIENLRKSITCVYCSNPWTEFLPGQLVSGPVQRGKPLGPS